MVRKTPNHLNINYLSTLNEAKQLQVYFPAFDSSSSGKKMYFYVDAEGSTYYADKENDGISDESKELLGVNNALTEAHLARKAPILDGTLIPNTAQCTDSDEGVFSEIAGKVRTKTLSLFGRAVYTDRFDRCASNTTLIEYYCNKDRKAQSRQMKCENGCENGACKIKEPQNPLDNFKTILNYQENRNILPVTDTEFWFANNQLVARELIDITSDIDYPSYLKILSNNKIYETSLKLKGNTRRFCYPLNFNLKFKKNDLFKSMSPNAMGYKKLRFIPECEGMQTEKKWDQPLEYLNYKIFKFLGFKEIDIVDFIKINHIKVGSRKTEDWGIYMLLQRTGEEDDQSPFLRKYELLGRNEKGDLYEVGKTAGVDNLELEFEWDYFTELKNKNTGLKSTINELEMIQYIIMTNFFGNWDSIHNNLKFAKSKNSEMYHIVPYDFDASLIECNERKISFINTIAPYKDKPLETRIKFYETIKSFYGKNDVLLQLFYFLDEFPALSKEDKTYLKKILLIRQAQGYKLYSSNEFLLSFFSKSEIDSNDIKGFSNPLTEYFETILQYYENSNDNFCLSSS